MISTIKFFLFVYLLRYYIIWPFLDINFYFEDAPFNISLPLFYTTLYKNFIAIIIDLWF